MEARQRVKLSLTNRSIGLISCEYVPRSSKPARRYRYQDRTSIRQTHRIEYLGNILKTHTASADGPSGGWSTWWS